MKEFDFSREHAVKAEPLTLSDHDKLLVERLLRRLLDTGPKQLAQLQNRIARNEGLVRIFVHHTWNQELHDIPSHYVTQGALLHVDSARQSTQTAPVFLFESVYDVTPMKKKYADKRGIFVIPTKNGDGQSDYPTAKRLLREFDAIQSHAKNHAAVSHVLYRVILSGLGVKKILMGGIYRDDCMIDITDAARSLSIPVTYSRFNIDGAGEDHRGESARRPYPRIE